MGKHKFAIAGLGLIVLILLGVTIVIPAMRRSAQKMEYDTLVTRPLASVRNGATEVSIMDTELLHQLAADQNCVENLTEVIFSSVTLDVGDQTALRNCKTLGQ